MNTSRMRQNSCKWWRMAVAAVDFSKSGLTLLTFRLTYRDSEQTQSFTLASVQKVCTSTLWKASTTGLKTNKQTLRQALWLCFVDGAQGVISHTIVVWLFICKASSNCNSARLCIFFLHLIHKSSRHLWRDHVRHTVFVQCLQCAVIPNKLKEIVLELDKTI